MLAPKAQYNLGDAKKYFKEHLAVGDYYAVGQTVPGHWFGQGAAELGLNGITTGDEFTRLCENLHPQTGERDDRNRIKRKDPAGVENDR